MIDIDKYSYIKYLLFGSLYFSEGLIKVISTLILPLYFLEKGVSPELITLVIGIGAIPMIVKFFWGGIVDYFIKIGRRRFILMGGLLATISLFLLSFIDPGIALIPFSIFVFISWCGVGFLDVSSDALAIEISSEKERGKINGSMFFGQNSGMTIGAIFFPFLAHTLGYNSVFIAAGLLVLIIIIFPLVIKEKKTVKKREKITPLLIKEFKKKSTQLIAILSPIIAASGGLLILAAPLYMSIELHLDEVLIGLIIAIYTISVSFGSLIGGVLSDRWGRKNTMYLLLGISIFFVASLIFTNNWNNFMILFSTIGFLQGGYTAAYLALFMDITNPKVGATQFSILTGLGNLGTIGTGAVSGTLLVMFGSGRLFLYAAWVIGPALIILNFVRFKKKNNKM